MQIRPETVQDYASIARIHARAFGERPGEALIVALHRQRPVFDPELSLVAEQDGQIVGHVLFNPQTMRLMGQNLKVVNLSPIAIDPAYQKQGIGGQLIETGHKLAREKGYVLSILLGHPSYYPRFGYLTHVYGSSELTLSAKELPSSELISRSLAEADLEALHNLWQQNESAVDFALDPGHELLDWLSPNPAIKATVFIDKAGTVAGYVRSHSAEPNKPRFFLAQDSTKARQIAAFIAREASTQEVVLPLHPASAISPGLGTANCRAWEAGMAYPLVSGIFEEYYARLKAGQRSPGRPIWPTIYDLN
jgi:predicted N-acetyltransferase YhbS